MPKYLSGSALHNSVHDIENQLLCFDVQREVGVLYDEMRRSLETFQRNMNKLTLNVMH